LTRNNQKAVWHAVEHELHRELEELGPLALHHRFVLMVSGGADSVALLKAFAQLANLPSRPLSVEVLHFHHGRGQVSLPVQEFREASRLLVQRLAEEAGFRFSCVQNFNAGDLSEAEAREFRRDEVAKRHKAQAQEIYVWGHHQDDLLETRFLRLIRGTGLQGLQAMSAWKAPHFRPWLRLRRHQLEDYLGHRKASWLQDPDQHNLRCWVRNEFFPILESRKAGSVSALARSLEQIVHASLGGDKQQLPGVEAKSLSQAQFLGLSREQKRQTLAQYLLTLGVRNYTRGQIDEIIKRLDNPQVVHRFNVAGLEWWINAEQIRALPGAK
jgi:tRNA(Ile)-lysidine synthase